ncbi:predicted protein [Sclerotinia sclerotiorum 1980 UF-70]|uniref:Uncharacterized protein n=1 Tax=Sclerotinia sclerotiorum (strain ATCC 18683 / 1980 / Ss-1) TaxID=665079 RepID=A7EPE5_SCLS1|nr:predicted protein [Sclerotinia sclerotiorum 1980 UF-70]EDO04711.1 predicted protein [Sclerotinia sclerotiorum 1980 UF-70]
MIDVKSDGRYFPADKRMDPGYAAAYVWWKSREGYESYDEGEQEPGAFDEIEPISISMMILSITMK